MLELKPLWEIQVLDDQKRSLEQKLRDAQISVELRTLKREIESGRAAFNKLKEDYASFKKQIKMKEMDAAAAAEQIRELSEKLYSGAITNVKEIDSSSKKLESLKDKVKRTEDEILAIMEQREELRARLEEMSSKLNNKAENYRQKHGSFLANQQKIRQQLAQLPLARQKLMDKVDPDLWNNYMSMKKRFNDPLARVEKGTCMGCRVGITFSELRLLKHGEGMVFCSHCGRMLYWER